MADDPLDKETSLSVELTESGVQAKAKSRALAAFDRLVGNLVDFVNLPVERRNDRARAVIAGEKKIIEAAATAAMEQLKAEPELARRAVENHFNGIFRKQANKEAIVIEAAEQLKLEPPKDSDGNTGPEMISEEFIDRFESYADGASTEQMRSKWGRVLASEICKPGTFSPKALRLVDELDPEVARLFEEVCEARLSDVLPKGIANDLSFSDKAKLSTSGLLIDPGTTGQVRMFESKTDSGGAELWVGGFGDYAIGFDKEATLNNKKILLRQNERPALPVYVLTSEGAAIASILPDQQEAAFQKLIAHLREGLPQTSLLEYRRVGSAFHLIARYPPVDDVPDAARVVTDADEEK